MKMAKLDAGVGGLREENVEQQKQVTPTHSIASPTTSPAKNMPRIEPSKKQKKRENGPSFDDSADPTSSQRPAKKPHGRVEPSQEASAKEVVGDMGRIMTN